MPGRRPAIEEERGCDRVIAALRYCHPNDAQSVTLSQKLAQDGLDKTLAEICGIPSGSAPAQEIAAAWNE